jgi:hypothetical protein
MQYAKTLQAQNAMEQQRQSREAQMRRRREHEEGIRLAQKLHEQYRQQQVQQQQFQQQLAAEQQRFQQPNPTDSMKSLFVQSQLAYERERLARLELVRQQRYNANLQHAGTSSNPISVDDFPPHFPVPKRNPFLPTPSVQTPPLLNNGWSASYQLPSQRPAAQTIVQSQPSYMYPSYDWNVPGPSTEEIKDLLSNIRPDEEIKVEDKDAILDGMAPQMRLMKHQQVPLPF